MSTFLRRLNSNNCSSPTSTTAALNLSEEYEEIQKANIFPSVQEDLSCTSDQQEDTNTLSPDTTAHVSHSGSPTTSVTDLQSQVESLRQQLAERDATVNELQRQIQEDKRSHDKLQSRWDLFFGSTNTNTSASSTTDMHRVNKHMDQLEAEKEACLQKTVKLSVALADSKAKISTLESQVEECQSIILIQNKAPIGFNRIQQPTTKQQAQPKLKRTSTSSSSCHSNKTTSSSAHARAPGGRPSVAPLDSFLPICDIQLNDDSNHYSSDAPQDNSFHDSNDGMLLLHDSSECLSLESESLGWTGRSRTLSLLSASERTNSSRRRRSSNNHNRMNNSMNISMTNSSERAATTSRSERGTPSTGSAARWRLRQIRNMISSSSSNRNDQTQQQQQ